MLSGLKMSQKIIGGFIVVVIMLSAVIAYQILGMHKMGLLEDKGANRGQIAIQIGSIMATIDNSYSTIAEAIINRRLDQTKTALTELESQSAKEATLLLTLTDTEEEKAWANEYITNFKAYLAIFKDELLPLLTAKASDAALDAATMAVIRGLDDRIDAKRVAADTSLEKIVQASNKELVEANELFDKVHNESVTLATIIAIVSVLFAMAIAFLLTRSITKPINETVQSLNNGSAMISSAAGQVSTASQTLAEGASSQASSLEETSASMEELTSMTRQNADNAGQADTLMRQSLATIVSTSEAMAEMDSSMSRIAEASEQTSKIIKTIDEIAFQTNLLALNAAVEAARAGEAGAGFAVVADEVRNLAMRATEAAKNTAGLIEDTVQKVKVGKDIVAKVSESFKEVSESSAKVGSLVGEISAASKEQSQGISQICQAITQMDSVTQQNAASSEESAAAAEELNAQAESMIETVMMLRSLVNGQQGGCQRRTAPPVTATQTPSAIRRPALERPPAAVTVKPMPKKLTLAAPTKKNAAPKANDLESVIPMGDDTFADF